MPDHRLRCGYRECSRREITNFGEVAYDTRTNVAYCCPEHQKLDLQRKGVKGKDLIDRCCDLRFMTGEEARELIRQVKKHKLTRVS